ncbi:MAG: MgtC/SapB family protein, partial [Bdellovibrionia bacterium]
MNYLVQYISLEPVKIVMVLLLSFLIGLEREERKSSSSRYAFGGIRTLPLIGLMGYVMALLSGNHHLFLCVGFLVLGALMALSFYHKLSVDLEAGVTSEVSGLITFLLGALIYHERFWLASALVVFSMLLLEMKISLEQLSKRISSDEILTFTKFLLLTIVILPIVPNEPFGPFHINLFKTWLIVVAISSVSYGSYILQKIPKKWGGIFFASLLGGAYSSTVTVVLLAKRARTAHHIHLFNGGILAASGMMYLRIVILLILFNRELFHLLAPSFLALAAGAIVFGFFWAKKIGKDGERIERESQPKNPLELRTAFMFAVLFVLMSIITPIALAKLGKVGIYSLAALMGAIDIDPFILSLTQSASVGAPLELAAASIVITAASNSAIKGIYAYIWSGRKLGLMSLVLLLGLAFLG